ncbi:MAG: hypothetical protein ABIT58_05515 [Ferruginibacter sp.]
MEMVTVRTFDNYFSANVILLRLKDAGIKCYLIDEHTVTINYFWGNAIGGIKLTVNQDDFEKTINLLKQFDEEYLREVLCPRCGANNISLVSKPITLNFISGILNRFFPGSAITEENIYQCQQCGYESKILPENMLAHN